MPPATLIDTGALLALVDRGDEWHAPCVVAYNRCRLPLLTTEAVLTEVFHLTRGDRREISAVWILLRSGAVQMAPISHQELPQIQSLMDDYADRPMDFADATVVYLAARETLSMILTVDHGDFETYRLPGRKKFTILPARDPK
jgi:predicted nucleic acid-binding protein